MPRGIKGSASGSATATVARSGTMHGAAGMNMLRGKTHNWFGFPISNQKYTYASLNGTGGLVDLTKDLSQMNIIANDLAFGNFVKQPWLGSLGQTVGTQRSVAGIRRRTAVAPTASISNAAGGRRNRGGPVVRRTRRTTASEAVGSSQSST